MRRDCWALALVLFGYTLTLGADVQAQDTGAAAARTVPFGITDNSFFVEEAFNQERGVVQNIFTWTRCHGCGWEGSITQEWPAPGMMHQLSYTVPFDGGNGGAHLGGVLLNYRFQALTEGRGRPAFSPRLSLVLPTGRADDAGDRPGLQVNLPLSKQVGDVYVHANAGVTWLHGAPLGGSTANLTSSQVAGSLIWRMQPMWHLMLESVVSFDDTVRDTPRGPATLRERTVLISPGIRGGWNVGDAQWVIGVAVPMTTSSGDTSAALLTYLSYELPFRKLP